MAGEHSFPISPQVPKSSDLRGQVKFKLMTVSEDLVFPGNCKRKILLVQTVYLIHFTAHGTNEEVRRKSRQAPSILFSRSNFVPLSYNWVGYFYNK